MFQYIINIPYERKDNCIEIGIQINGMEDVCALILCHNKKLKKIIYYLECDKAYIKEICASKIIIDLNVVSAKNFWDELAVKEWIIYPFVEGNEYYNRIMVKKIFDL